MSNYKGIPATEEGLLQAQQRDIKSMKKLPKIFDQKVDMNKVNRNVIKSWIIKTLNGYLPGDDIVIDFTLELFEEQFPDIKYILLQLQGFLEKNTVEFTTQVWSLLLEAQVDPQGIPPKLVEEKKKELLEKGIKSEENADDESYRGARRGEDTRNEGRERREGRDDRYRSHRDDQYRDGGERRSSHREYRDRSYDRDASFRERKPYSHDSRDSRDRGDHRNGNFRRYDNRDRSGSRSRESPQKTDRFGRSISRRYEHRTRSVSGSVDSRSDSSPNDD